MQSAHSWLVAQHKSLTNLMQYAAGIRDNANTVLNQQEPPPDGPGVALEYPGRFDLVTVASTAQELNNALAALADLVAAPLTSPTVKKLETGSLLFEVLLDPNTWTVLREHRTPIAEGIGLMAGLWKVLAGMRQNNIPTEPAEEMVKAKKRELAEKAVSDVVATLPDPVSPENRGKAVRAASYFVEVVSEGVTVRMLSSGEPDFLLDASELNRALKELQPVIAEVRQLSAGQSKRLPPPAPESPQGGGPDNKG